MTQSYRLSAEEIRTIRKVAERVAHGRCLIEIGERVSLKTSEISINIALISDDLDLDETDLHDMLGWDEIKLPIQLNNEGRAFIDLYLSEMPRRGERGEMLDQIQIAVDNGRMIGIFNNGSDFIWRAE